MSQQRKAWKPSPAAKPSHLSTQTVSGAALQGAALAFAASPQTPSLTVQQLGKHYDIHDRSRGSVTGASEGARSPSRGRHPELSDAQLVSARLAATSTSPPVPTVLGRSPSMIAARLASASPSPVQSTAESSPPKETTREDGRPALTPSRLSQGSVQALDFDNVPRLRPKPVDRSLSTASKESVVSQSTNDPARTGLSSQANEGAPVITADPVGPKPPVPAPRKGAVRGALKPNLTGPKQDTQLSREEIINRMADAMVASSLASSRAPSPTAPAKGRGLGRRSVSAHNLYHIPSVDRPPLPRKPQRQMKLTLRKQSPNDEDDEIETTKRGRRHLVRKHPNMHHEGDRKRWRDKVTEIERKRYEGVFAANRGLLLKSADPRASPSRVLDPTSENNQVANVVVRDIWERSRLPAHVLEQIYELVSPDDARALNREQFVVGLWLIDQKLKGRKLPVKVSDSVWSSVRHAQGIKISRRP